MALEGLDAAFRKIVPDFVVTSGIHVEEESWAKSSTLGRVESFTPQTAD